MAVVLIAEDDLDISEVLQHVFTRAGFTVLDAADGLQAMEKVVSSVPDLVLSDLDMPGMDGLQLCAAIRADPRTAAIPVALLSGSLRHGDPRVLAAKACRAWIKPFANSALVAGIRDLLATGRHLHVASTCCEPVAPAVRDPTSAPHQPVLPVRPYR